MVSRLTSASYVLLPGTSWDLGYFDDGGYLFIIDQIKGPPPTGVIRSWDG
jgi:hypothetical protein